MDGVYGADGGGCSECVGSLVLWMVLVSVSEVWCGIVNGCGECVGSLVLSMAVVVLSEDGCGDRSERV